MNENTNGLPSLDGEFEQVVGDPIKRHALLLATFRQALVALHAAEERDRPILTVLSLVSYQGIVAAHDGRQRALHIERLTDGMDALAARIQALEDRCPGIE